MRKKSEVLDTAKNLLTVKKALKKTEMDDGILKEGEWEALGISNDFLFGKVMLNPDICKELLQIILPHLTIQRIEYPELQKGIDNDRDAKSVRLDVYVESDKGTVYDIEMQVADVDNIPKRSRYYQAMIDLQLLGKGKSETYAKLRDSYVIFICTFDLFKQERQIYTFKNICEEDNRIYLDDGTTKIFLNSKGWKDNVSENLRAFLDFVEGKPSNDEFVRKLERELENAKKNREWRHEYMTLLMRDMENMRKGTEIGEKRGAKQMGELAKRLIEDDRTEDIRKATEDEEYRQKLYKEYNIS